MVIRDPETGEHTKEMVFWINLISEILNNTQLAEKGEPGSPVSIRFQSKYLEKLNKNFDKF